MTEQSDNATRETASAETPLVDIDNLHVEIDTRQGKLSILNGVSFSIARGEAQRDRKSVV